MGIDSVGIGALRERLAFIQPASAANPSKSEVFPYSVRGKGQALGSLTHWFFAVAITFLFSVFSSSSP